MYSLRVLPALAALAGLASAAPAVTRDFTDPTTNGFPNPNAQQLMIIEKEADGQISNAPPPPTLANSSLTAFQLIAFNELFEVAFFSSLVYNITNNVTGFETDADERMKLLNILDTVTAQEELHAISALDVLNHFGAFAPSPCEYTFPSTDLKSAFTLAETFTAVVLGTLQDASQLLATNGDAAPVRTIASVIGNEGEQNGFYRDFLDLKPSEKPFLTTSTAAFAFSILNQVFVASCPFDLAEIALPILAPLTVLSGDGGANVTATDQTLQFSADLSSCGAGEGGRQHKADGYVGGRGEGLFITYLTGQNLPVSEPVSNVRWEGKTATFEAFFPFEANVMDGLSIAALTTSSNFSSADAVVNATLAAPGLIQVNDMQ